LNGVRIAIKKISVNCSKFESSNAKPKKLFNLSLREEEAREAIHRVTSKLKNKEKISNEEFLKLTVMILNKFDKPYAV
jgi:hypothetical protein